MELSINGQSTIVNFDGVATESEGASDCKLYVADLLRLLKRNQDFIAVAVNRVCIPRGEYAQTLVCEGDAIEILAPMAGG